MTLSKRPLTVLMPVYNAEKYLTEAIESILKQSFSNFDFLIIDDGSKDSSKDIISSFATSDSRIKFVQNETNLGLVKTLNRGLDLITTPLMARQDADDLSKPERFEKQVKFLDDHPLIAMVGSSFEIIDRENKKDIFLPTRHSQILEVLRYGNCFAHGSVMLRTNDFKNLGGYSAAEDAAYIEDYEAWARMSAKHKVANLPQILYSYRLHGESISSKNQPQQFRNTVALGKKLINIGPTLISPTIYRFPSMDDPNALSRQEQTLPQLFQAAKIIWKNNRKSAAIWRLVMISLFQPRFILKSLKNHFRSVK